MLPSYEVVDAILYRLIEDGQSREEIINAGFDSDEVQKIYAMVMRNEKAFSVSAGASTLVLLVRA